MLNVDFKLKILTVLPLFLSFVDSAMDEVRKNWEKN